MLFTASGESVDKFAKVVRKAKPLSGDTEAAKLKVQVRFRFSRSRHGGQNPQLFGAARLQARKPVLRRFGRESDLYDLGLRRADEVNKAVSVSLQVRPAAGHLQAAIYDFEPIVFGDDIPELLSLADADCEIVQREVFQESIAGVASGIL